MCAGMRASVRREAFAWRGTPQTNPALCVKLCQPCSRAQSTRLSSGPGRDAPQHVVLARSGHGRGAVCGRSEIQKHMSVLAALSLVGSWPSCRWRRRCSNDVVRHKGNMVRACRVTQELTAVMLVRRTQEESVLAGKPGGEQAQNANRQD